jgi:nucleoside-diphosphate-sugar epimerase
MSKQVLVTGSAGTIGRVVVQALQARGHRVRGFDRLPTPDLADQVVGGLQDADAVRRAMTGCQALIHLAATPDQADFVSDLVPNNVVGLYHVLEAAREAALERVVLASTIRVGMLHDWERNVVRVGDGLAPHDWYSFTKAAGEVMGEMYARLHGMTVVCARFGWVVRTAEEVRSHIARIWHSGIMLSQDDAGRFAQASIDNQLHFRTAHRFAAMFVTSRPMAATAVDLAEARSVTGYEPQDTWPQGSPWVDVHARLRESKA